MRQSLSLVWPALPYRVHALPDPGNTTTGGVTLSIAVDCFFFSFETYVTLHGAMRWN